MDAIRRAQADIDAGDLGSARRRLMSRAVSKGYEPGVCERVARLCVQMRDPIEAGRWYFLCESADPEAGPLVERYVEALKRDAGRILADLPSSLYERFQNGAGPAIVEQRLSTLGATSRVPRGVVRAPRATFRQQITGAGCAIGTALLGLCTIVGMITVVKFLRAW